MSEETTYFRGSPSLLLRAGPLSVAALAVVGGVVGGFALSPWVALAAAVGFLYAVGVIIELKSHIYEFTSERVRVTKGIMTKRTDELELYRVKDTSLIEPFLMRMFSLGDIEIATTDTSTPTLLVKGIPGARQLREQLRQSVEDCRTRKKVRLTELE